MENQKIRVLIADDEKFQAVGFKDLLAYSDQILVIGICTTSHETSEMIKRCVPDVIMLDLEWHRNVEPGFGLIREISELHPGVAIMAMTHYREYLDDAKQAGADMSFFKGQLSDTESMVNLIKETLQAHRMNKMKATEPLNSHSADKLTERESEVLEQLCKGNTNKEIADELNISIKTVKTHVSNTLSKLGVSNRAQAISEALRRGLVKLK